MFKISIDQVNALANFIGEKHSYFDAEPYINILRTLEKSEEAPELKEVTEDLQEAS